MKLLALDTATEACSAAVWVDGAIHAYSEVVGREHTHRLIPVVSNALAAAGLRYADLDGLVCSVGPGSFAGVRIGVAFAKGVAFAHALPVVGVPSLALLAQGARRTALSDGVLVAIDARMSEVYFQAFTPDADGVLQAAGEARVCAPSAVTLPSASGRWCAVGTGWGTYEAVLRETLKVDPVSIDGLALPQAEHAFALALPQFEGGEAIVADALQPVYLRNQIALTLIQQRQLRAAAQQAR